MNRRTTSLHFDRCSPPERAPLEYKCTVPIVAGYDRYSEFFHCCRGSLADNLCSTQVKCGIVLRTPLSGLLVHNQLDSIFIWRGKESVCGCRDLHPGKPYRA